MAIATEKELLSAIMTDFPPVRKVLVIAPHPDDEVFGCGGTISLLQSGGSVVTTLIVTSGALGGDNADGKLIETRAEESRGAARILGLNAPVFWGLPDRGIGYGEVLIGRLIETIRETDADLVFLPSPTDWHPDHQAIAFAGAEAIRRLGGKRQAAFYEVSDPLPCPNLIHDISAVEALKRQAMRCFSSQLQEQPYDTRVSGINSFRAFHLGAQVKSAEAFTLLTADDLGNGLSILLDGPLASRRKLGFATSGGDTPLVSVIIRSMDRATLTDALDSLALQTYSNIEVILVNAKGHEHREIEQWCGRFPVRFVSSGEKLARSRAANAGLDSARGDYLIFLDDDDWFDPPHIAQLVEILIANRNAVAAFSGVRCLREVEGSFEVARVFDEAFDPTRLMVENYIPIHALLFRRLTLEGDLACRLDEAIDLFEDWDFLLQLSRRGDFVRQPGISATYRIHAGSGQGVDGNEQEGIKALEYILSKWHPQWSVQQVRNLVARARLLDKLLHAANISLSNLQHELQELEVARALNSQQLQTAIAECSRMSEQFHAAEHERSRMENEYSRISEQLHAAEHERSRMSEQLHAAENERSRWLGQLRIAEDERLRLVQQLRTVGAEHQRILQSRSWRITSPIRRISTSLYSLKDWSAELSGRTMVWRVLRACYRSTLLGPVRKSIPITVKRRLRDFFSRTHLPREMPVFSGHPAGSPLVSIIVPVYQHADYLRRCISSALAQNYTNIEVVVVNDASPDLRVREVLSEFANDPKARIFHNETNLGISRTQNRALLASKGDVIAFLDCDDFLSPDAVEICLRSWNAETVYSHSARINIDKNGDEVSRICFQHLPRQDYFTENLAAMYATHFKMIRRDVFAKVGLFDQRFDTAQDYDMLMRIAFHYGSERFAYVPHFVYFHRLHEHQATETAQIRQSEAVAIVRSEARLRRSIRKGKFDKRLSFIMLSFGKQTQTLEALKSLERTVRVPYEIILFDNGSDPETVAFLKANIEGKFGNLRVYYSDRNLGPADGRRAALEKASGDWFIIFDNDEIAEEGWLEEMLVRASSDPKIGAVTCKVIFPDHTLQCCGGFIEHIRDDVIHLQLYGRGLDTYNLETAEFRDCDWCPIGATLFTVNPGPFLHAGYPNIFEDVGVSMALCRQGYRLVNSPGSWVWHEHVTFRKNVEMGTRYTKERYDPKRMLISVASFYRENGLIIEDEYVWRENGLMEMSLESVRILLQALASETYPKNIDLQADTPESKKLKSAQPIFREDADHETTGRTLSS